LSEIMNNLSSLNRAIDERLADVRNKRGHVMAHHQVMAVLLPDLLESYERVFAAIDLTQGRLSSFEKGFVWMVVVAAGEIPIGGSHVRDFKQAGGSAKQVEAAAILGSIAIGSRTLGTIGTGWENVVTELNLEGAYRRLLESIASPAQISPELVEMAMAAAHACRRSWGRVRAHIKAAYALGVNETALAEALTITMLPTGTPTFVQACKVWLDLIKTGEVSASAALLRVARTLDKTSP
jgi:alkylhydroperoxidase/carboxymuconolactone decarboxylase family protein YurZ